MCHPQSIGAMLSQMSRWAVPSGVRATRCHLVIPHPSPVLLAAAAPANRVLCHSIRAPSTRGSAHVAWASLFLAAASALPSAPLCVFLATKENLTGAVGLLGGGAVHSPQWYSSSCHGRSERRPPSAARLEQRRTLRVAGGAHRDGLARTLNGHSLTLSGDKPRINGSPCVCDPESVFAGDRQKAAHSRSCHTSHANDS
jgi:hypothetical protein